MSNLKYDKAGTAKMRKALARQKKVKITINFDGDLLAEVKRLADEMGAPYQTLLNKIVRGALEKKSEQEARLDRLEKEIKAIKKKLVS